jgi:hypothetical protein
VTNTKRAVRAARAAKQLPEWLDRDLIRSPYCITLCTTAEMFLAEQQRIGVIPHDIRMFPKRGAAVHFFEREDFADPTAMPAMIVTLSDQAKECEPIQIAAMLCHEAVHVVQEVMKTIGEKSPSSEFYAYSVQAVAQNLMYEYVRQTT